MKACRFKFTCISIVTSAVVLGTTAFVATSCSCSDNIPTKPSLEMVPSASTIQYGSSLPAESDITITYKNGKDTLPTDNTKFTYKIDDQVASLPSYFSLQLKDSQDYNVWTLSFNSDPGAVATLQLSIILALSDVSSQCDIHVVSSNVPDVSSVIADTNLTPDPNDYYNELPDVSDIWMNVERFNTAPSEGWALFRTHVWCDDASIIWTDQSAGLGQATILATGDDYYTGSIIVTFTVNV